MNHERGAPAADEERLRLVLEAERTARADAEAAWLVAEAARRRLGFLARASELLSGSLDVDAVARETAALVAGHLADWCVVSLLDDRRQLVPVAVTHKDPGLAAWCAKLRDQRAARPATENEAVRRVLVSGRPELVPSLPEMVVAAVEPPDQVTVLRELGFASAIVVPLRARAHTLGVMELVSADPAHRLAPDDLGLAEDLARRAALAIDNARLYQEASHIATALEQTLLPRDLPDIPGMEMAARYRPGRAGLDIGGDFYDVFELEDDTLGIAIGDVCGKGADAAAITGLARHTVRAAAMRDRSAERVLHVLNDALLRDEAASRFCTLVFARLRRAAFGARLSVACGGHPSPLVVHADGGISRVAAKGTLVGVFEELDLQPAEVDLRPGESIVMFTDGVLEARAGCDIFGEERARRALRGAAGGSAEELAGALLRAVADFEDGSRRDDVAIVVVRIRP